MKSVRELLSLRGRVALITGGAGHVGRAMAAALAEQGADLALLDVAEDSLEEAVEQLRQQYDVQVLPLSADLNDQQFIQNLPKQVEATFGCLDILINNAALVGTSALQGWGVPFMDQSVDTWRLALEVNLTAVFGLTQAATPLLSARGMGSIINVSSIYGIVGPQMGLYKDTPMGNPAAYAVSKGGLIQFTRWLATTLAPHVRANCITLGGIWRNQPQQFIDRYEAHTPMQRMAREEDVKGAALYLASDLSSYVTGHNLVVDGGWSVW